MAGIANSPIGSVQALRAEIQGLKRDAEETRNVLATTQAAVGSLSSSIQESSVVREQFIAQADRAQKKVEETKRELGALDELYNRVSEGANQWDEELTLQLEALRIGQLELSQFLAMWGDAETVTADGVKKIRELMDGFNARQYVQQIQDLISGLRTGGATIGDVLAYLKENASTLSKALVEAVEAFKRGETSLDAVLKLIERGRKDFAGTEFEALAEALADALRNGSLA